MAEGMTEWHEPDGKLVGARPIGFVLLRARSDAARAKLLPGMEYVLAISAHAPWPLSGWEWERKPPSGLKEPGQARTKQVGSFSNEQLKTQFNERMRDALLRCGPAVLDAQGKIGLALLGGDFNRKIDADPPEHQFQVLLPDESILLSVPDEAKGKMTFVDFDDSNSYRQKPAPHYPFIESEDDFEDSVKRGECGTDLVLFGTPPSQRQGYDVLHYKVESTDRRKPASDHLFVEMELQVQSGRPIDAAAL